MRAAAAGARRGRPVLAERRSAASARREARTAGSTELWTSSSRASGLYACRRPSPSSATPPPARGAASSFVQPPSVVKQVRINPDDEHIHFHSDGDSDSSPLLFPLGKMERYETSSSDGGGVLVHRGCGRTESSRRVPVVGGAGRWSTHSQTSRSAASFFFKPVKYTTDE